MIINIRNTTILIVFTVLTQSSCGFFDEPSYKYHPNPLIDNVIVMLNNAYNLSLTHKNEPHQVGRYQFDWNSVAISVAANDSYLFVDLSDESNDTEPDHLLNVGDRILKVVVPMLTAEDVEKIHQAIKTKKYTNNDKYENRGIKYWFLEHKLNNGMLDHRYTIEIPLSHLNI